MRTVVTGRIRGFFREVGHLPAPYGFATVILGIAILGAACGPSPTAAPQPKRGPGSQVSVLGVDLTVVDMDVHGVTVPCVIAGSKSDGIGLSVALDCNWGGR